MSAWTQADLDALEKAIATGARQVTYSDGTSIEYRGLDQMMRVRDQMRIDLGHTNRGPRTTYAKFTRG